MGINLATLTLDETKHLLSDSGSPTIGNLAIAPGALPPESVIAASLKRHLDGESWFWCGLRAFVLPGESVIVGSGSFKNSPRGGAVEIGYGVAEAYQGRNFATLGAKLLLAEGFSRPEVSVITAETAETNIASQRVLEKNGFTRMGTRVDPEDGALILWRLERQS